MMNIREGEMRLLLLTPTLMIGLSFAIMTQAAG
jgi:hypothetical protein